MNLLSSRKAWSEILESRAQYAASRVRRFAHFLHNCTIDPNEWYKPLKQSVLKNWPSESKFYIALDTTALTPFVLIRVSLIYRGRPIPLAWRAILFPNTRISFAEYQAILDQVYALIPEGMGVILLADRGFVDEELLHYVRTHHWHIRLRLKGNTIVHLPHRNPCPVRELCPPFGHASFFHNIALLRTVISPFLVYLFYRKSLQHSNCKASPGCAQKYRICEATYETWSQSIKARMPPLRAARACGAPVMRTFNRERTQCIGQMSRRSINPMIPGESAAGHAYEEAGVRASLLCTPIKCHDAATRESACHQAWPISYSESA